MHILLLELLVTDHLCDGWDVHVLNFVLVGSLWIHNKNSTSSVKTLRVNRNRQWDLDWPYGVLFWKLVEDDLQVDEPIILKQILRLVFFVESKQILYGRLDEVFI